jgi:hypothetical protein
MAIDDDASELAWLHDGRTEFLGPIKQQRVECRTPGLKPEPRTPRVLTEWLEVFRTAPANHVTRKA